LQGRQGRLGLAGQVGQHPDHERQRHLLHGAAGFDVVGDLYARPADPVELVLVTLTTHVGSPGRPGRPRRGAQPPSSRMPSSRFNSVMTDWSRISVRTSFGNGRAPNSTARWIR